jgi:hypothetical protein
MQSSRAHSVSLTEMQNSMAKCPPLSESAIFPQWLVRFRALAHGLRIFNYFEGEVEPPELIRVHRLARAKDKITINDYNDRKMTKYED